MCDIVSMRDRDGPEHIRHAQLGIYIYIFFGGDRGHLLLSLSGKNNVTTRDCIIGCIGMRKEEAR